MRGVQAAMGRAVAAGRALADDTFNRTCTVPGGATVVTNAGNGTWSEDAGAGTPNVKCSFKAAAGNERVVGGSIAQIGNYILNFERGVALRSNMTILVDATEEEPARTFQLVAPLDGSVTIRQRWLATEG